MDNIQQEEEQEETNRNKTPKIKSMQSPLAEKTQPCEVSTNQASNHIDMNIVQSNDNKVITS